jgi:hypothetical protein
MSMARSRAVPVTGSGGGLAARSARRRRIPLVVAAGAAALCAGLLTHAGTASAASSHAAVAAVRWGLAKEVPGLAALNAGGNARVTSVSCWSAGNCAAGGFYTRKLGYVEAFVVDQKNGRWAKAAEVPGSATLNAGGNAQVVSVSCAPGGYCTAGGYYADRARHRQAFVVTRTKGRWGKAGQVPGLAALNTSGGAGVSSVSCPSAGNCAAGGSYTAVSGGQAFVVNETRYRWHTAIAVPALAALNVGGNAAVASLSCWSAGNCAAGGSYQTSKSFGQTGDYPLQAFVVSERNGAWHSAEEVPGTAALNSAMDAQVNSVSCAPGGYCAAVGYYEQGTDGPFYPLPFLVSERNGVWGAAQTPPNADVLNNGAYAPLVAVACPSAGDCTAAGYISELPPNAIDAHWQVWVVSQKNGIWRVPEPVPGLGAATAYGPLSCWSAGNCGAGSGASVASERTGRWGKAVGVPGLAALSKGKGAAVVSVSCPSARDCVAAGFYSDGHHRTQAFVGGAK